MINIADLSLYNHMNDWDKASQELDGVILKSSQHYWQDPAVAQMLPQALAKNMRVALYHFYQPDSPASDQIEPFLNVYMPAKLKSTPWLDVEDIVYTTSTGQRVNIQPPQPLIYTDWILDWLERVENMTGIVPGIYTRAEYWNRAVVRSDRWKLYPLWVANYGVAKPVLPLDWKTYSIWQDKSTAKYTWTDGNVDHDIFNGDLAALDKLMPRPAPVVTPPPAPVGTYEVRLLGSIYALTVRSGPGVTYVSTNKYLINTETPKLSRVAYTVAEVKNGWGLIAKPYPGWINLVCTAKVG